MNITIVGGGFGGVKAAERLSKDKNNQITLISDRDDFQYYPALYSTATGRDYRESWIPLENIFDSCQNITIIKDRIQKIDPKKRTLTGEGVHHYETLILALGSVTTYFGIKGLDTYAFGIKSHQEIARLQAHLFNEMSVGKDDEKNYVIIGAGPTGVELAGALGEYVRRLRQHFGIKKKRLNITLIEAAPCILPRMSKASSIAAGKRLKELGIKIETNKKVEQQTAEGLIVNGKQLLTQTVIWTSGVANSPFFAENSEFFKLDGRGKVVVDETMRTDHGIYVIGDNAATPYAGLAQAALHDAIYVAKHIGGRHKPNTTKVFPSVVPVGDGWAVFEWHWLRLKGWPGSLLRSAADIIGYSDVLPLGWAMKSWRAGYKQELRIPESLANTHAAEPVPVETRQ